MAINKSKATIVGDVGKEPLVGGVEGRERDLHDGYRLDNVVGGGFNNVDALGIDNNLHVSWKLLQSLEVLG